MLIQTDRHTEADLRLYSRLYQPMDRLKRVPARKVEQSKDIIADWINTHTDAIACTSWGKDSVVLLYLLACIGAKIPVVYMRLDHANPDCDMVRDTFLAKYDLDYHEEFFIGKEVKNDSHWKSIAKKYGEHRLTGIRNDESGVRQMIYCMHGTASILSCRPLSLWKNPEIFAFIEQQGLPLNPVYGYLGGGRWPREYIRTHSLVGASGNGIGRTEWEREYYPDLVNRILAKDF